MSGFEPANVVLVVGAIALFGWLAVWADFTGWRRRRAKLANDPDPNRLPWWIWAARLFVIASVVFAMAALYWANRGNF